MQRIVGLAKVSRDDKPAGKITLSPHRTTWYLWQMDVSSNSFAPSKQDGFVLGSRKAEKIGAVEGMKLSPRMRGILEEARERGFNGDERRALVRKAASNR